ncbi:MULTISPECIES: PilX N-terminal domain-containing pilus assembly protein [unclassified Motilimonas]|uniref:PilX N-terminal domain-containing pilus assembly protein n=1 Tax=Motilimonas TaxID=1914248 RepID=UPI001E466FD2|nr:MULTISPECIES: PilX N-terminal domain-containing pilus assembly protein [unclassified Motilimonas]MCE0558652.1 hypothetical protein [Motilimonas sp. E26]MDO6525682.1 hypothetical protein [Motilimonas sp. 1_MG-2023]
MKFQQGIALFISIILLLLLSGLTTLLMSNASLDLKMAGASAQRIDADQQLEGAISEILTNANASQQFATAALDTKFEVKHIKNISTAIIAINEQPSCARSKEPSSVGLFSCRYLDTRLSKQYGRAKTGGGHQGENAAGLGVEQKLLKK